MYPAQRIKSCFWARCTTLQNNFPICFKPQDGIHPAAIFKVFSNILFYCKIYVIILSIINYLMGMKPTMWRCTCGYQNSDIGNFCVACGTPKNAAISAQLGDNIAWFYYKGSHRFGPASSSEIAGLLHAGELDRNTMVWKAGMNNWVPLYQTALSAVAPHLMPPPPLESASDVYAWLLAICPFIVGIVLTMLKVNNIGIILAISVLSLLFWALDVWELKKTKNSLSAWIWLVFLLTPAYLFVRSSKAGKRYGYSSTWCIIYVCYLFTYALSLFSSNIIL
ncbi:MAG: hypothetical protein K0S22_1068 [Oscillospiraceae bacterium]|nr:hypothetical protein [Oscillospiraceae bacterium]